MYRLYVLMAAISLYFRHFVLPNPFEKLSNNFFIGISGMKIILPPILLNIIAEPILYALTFAVVGFYYIKGECPAAGSFLYLVFYILHVGLIYLASLFGFTTWTIVAIIILYIAFHVAFNVLKEKISYGW